MGLITENNQQYYAGVQKFLSAAGTGQAFTTTFDTGLVLGSYDPLQPNYALNNFKLYTANAGVLTYTEYTSPYTVSGNTITFTGNLAANTSVVVQLKILSGGEYGNRDAYGNTVEENYGSYSYIKLDDIINNFLVAYVGDGKLITSCKRTDLVFHAKRGLQEFSYDTLKSIKSQELTIPPELSVVIPQDYVNYTKISWIDQLGVKRPIYPANNLTTNPFENPIQDSKGVPTQDNFGNNVEGTSITEERWRTADDTLINQDNVEDLYNEGYDSWGWDEQLLGQNYGLDPQYAQVNGWFTINHREGKISFSSNLAGALIVLEYISDGLASDMETKVPKLAEEALYAHMSHAVIASRINQPEYIVRRLKQERSAKLRNAKLRLSNIKLDEIVQVMRGKSKWLKH
ncbi:MAG: hypothetical protein OET18_10255 [Desulfobacterales bacterium]|jgi:hypothetical protein|nr:hypothetical protein [Desulfobacterales bacterium]